MASQLGTEVNNTGPDLIDRSFVAGGDIQAAEWGRNGMCVQAGSGCCHPSDPSACPSSTASSHVDATPQNQPRKPTPALRPQVSVPTWKANPEELVAIQVRAHRSRKHSGWSSACTHSLAQACRDPQALPVGATRRQDLTVLGNELRSPKPQSRSLKKRSHHGRSCSMPSFGRLALCEGFQHHFSSSVMREED